MWQYDKTKYHHDWSKNIYHYQHILWYNGQNGYSTYCSGSTYSCVMETTKEVCSGCLWKLKDNKVKNLLVNDDIELEYFEYLSLNICKLKQILIKI